MDRITPRLAVAALCLAALPHGAAAATLEAFAGVRIVFETSDVTNPVQIYTRQTVFGTDATDGDGTTSGGATQIEGSLTDAPVFATANEVRGEATAAVAGEAVYRIDLIQNFWVARSLDADRMVDITLSPLDGLGGTYLQAFGLSGAPGDIGAAFAAINLQRNDFEGDLYADSAFINLVGVLPGDFANDQKGLAPVTLSQLIPQRGPLDPDVRFTLTLTVETSALVEPVAVDPPDVGVIPLPPAAPLLALGLGCLALLRRRSGS